ncbi:HesA/MoeB/ThiF family protein [Alteromonas pelagimontana]|uniref:HesA/MoeB/ThiF family protein n=1 Tax=Alteromonas pelagimontana TaxID=1858656 RepID=A0A6M4MD68_9ALTE|nr:HesA/MoeB/ThiF family protein [Alteromonas pelagimontana]QJR81131.1 HesA/MoeB/ThiF family protein [Alteromonas pelagimontana]
MELSKEEYSRYSRQLLLSNFDEDCQLRLKQAKAIIMGVGGLGAICAHYLAAAGVGQLVLVDPDTVALSNLHRQTLYQQQDIGKLKAVVAAERLRHINSLVDVVPVTTTIAQLDASSLENASVVADCTDSVDARLQINQRCYERKIPLFVAAATGNKALALNILPGGPHGCAACLFAGSAQVEENCLQQGILGPVAGIAGLYQALAILQYLSGTAPIQWGVMHYFDASCFSWKTLNLPANPQCPYCGEQNARYY